ncbi:tetraspanin-CD63 receptor [Schistosoma japonicum]|nr:tetraspanin-CD63 receptor [Schistosoma japonicum]KAH8856509.1 tetraspanin-CD63 receptor [Schistosoma japonicum]
MPKTKVRYAFKGLNAVTGIICLSVLIMCTTVFWLKVSAYLLRPQLMKIKVPVNLNNVVLRSGLNYIMRNLLSPVTLPVIILGICYTSICAFGFFIAYNRNTTNFLIYEVLFTVCVVSHLVMFVIFLKDPSSMRLHAKTELEKLVKSYKSLSSMDAASLFLGMIMINTMTQFTPITEHNIFQLSRSLPITNEHPILYTVIVVLVSTLLQYTFHS